jgi:predicted dehydrogenase
MLRNASLAGVGLALSGRRTSGQDRSPNERLNIAFVGAGGQAAFSLKGLASENIMALCDVDDRRASKAFRQYPKARKYRDFRKMLDQMHKQIDAVVVCTPDHVHASASIRAMRLGKHVYCEKPLAWSIEEARLMAREAKENRVATQMGTQGMAVDGSRAGVEVVRSGVLGPVREMHVWTDRARGWWPQGVDCPKETPPIPNGLQWDLWLGPAPERPYHPAYVPFKWRGWKDFGTGAIGDMGIPNSK